jgi:hypothetical protein
MATEKQTSRKITQKMGELERAVKIKLQQFYGKKIKGSQLSITSLRQKYGQEIENLVRKTIEESWLFSNQILQEHTGTTIHTSQNDIQGIETLTNKMVNQFWVTSQKLLTRETELKTTETVGELQPLPEYDVPAAMISLGGLFAYFAFNSGMESKADELSIPVKLRFTNRDDCIDNAICIPLNGTTWNAGDPGIITPPNDTHRHCHCHLIPITD